MIRRLLLHSFFIQQRRDLSTMIQSCLLTRYMQRTKVESSRGCRWKAGERLRGRHTTAIYDWGVVMATKKISNLPIDGLVALFCLLHGNRQPRFLHGLHLHCFFHKKPSTIARGVSLEILDLGTTRPAASGC